MKTKLRKVAAIICVIALMMALVPTTVGAARVGDVIGYAKPTNISATINGYQLESYNVNGNTYIVVEDLVYYGFDVEWNGASRSLYFNLNTNKTYINPQIEMPLFNNIGRTTATRKLLYTDIKTYANGTLIPSYNINGKTIVQFDYLGQFGHMEYDDEARELYLILNGNANVNNLDLMITLCRDELNEIVDKSIRISSEVIVRAKGDILVCDIILNNPDQGHINAIHNGLVAEDRTFFGDMFKDLRSVLEFSKGEMVFRYKDNSIIGVVDFYV